MFGRSRFIRAVFRALAKSGGSGGSTGKAGDSWRGEKLSEHLEENLDRVQGAIAGSDDITVRRFVLGHEAAVRAAIVYVEGLTDKTEIEDRILKSSMILSRLTEPHDGEVGGDRFFPALEEAVLNLGSVKRVQTLDEALTLALTGFTVLLVDGFGYALALETKGWAQRSIDEPESQTVIRGPRDGFTETLRVNTALLRRRIRDPNLKIKSVQIGKRSKTDVAVAYISDLAPPRLVEEVHLRLKTVDMDIILESGYIEQFIEDNWLSPFPQVQATERPDECAAALMDGRVCIIVDNTPFALIVPTNLNAQMQTPEDYYHRWMQASVIRVIRVLANLLALVLPALYIALVAYNPEMLPTKLALSIAASRENVPFSAWLEVFMMEISFELLVEAGARLPHPIGQTIGIVGGLIIGQAAVQAKIVSQVVVIVVAVTSIGSFAIPKYDLAVTFRTLRFFLMATATLFGFYGLTMGLLLILAHAASLKSFGVGYLSPWSPTRTDAFGDTIIRAPWPSLKKRPAFFAAQDRWRINDERAELPEETAEEVGGKSGGKNGGDGGGGK